MAQPLEHLGQYRIVRELSAGRTFLALDEDDRHVVLKRLDEDCLLRGQLHTSIRERLAKVRELAHPRVGQLCGVERIPEAGVFLIWQYIAGVTFDQWLAADKRPQKQVAAIGREMALALEAVHRLGIVHGAVHGRNIMVQDGRAVLIDFSPLLYNDPAEDAAALAATLRPMVDAELAARLAGSVTHVAAVLGGSPAERPKGELDQEAQKIKRRAWLGAAGALAAGVCAAAVIWWFVHGAATEGVVP